MYDDLTLGSVVNVEVDGVSNKIMIVAKNLHNNNGLLIDYMGVVYPYGHIDGQDMVYFNKNLIKSVIHQSQKDKAVKFFEEFVINLSEEINDKRNISDRK